ncbi:YceI family protein [Pedobacter glucosidilyticus]|uniref:YceI family protein n=1 Tax=Pedobacter glucosidilyticus TaxID=1122941 RepID=UPI0026E98BFF|nr:YceI family protein [Pedobacter glucosidilyticus]
MKPYIHNITKTAYMACVMLFTFIYLPAVSAQTAYKVSTGSQIKVIGTSNIHDWDMTAINFICDANFTVKGTDVQDVSALSFVLPVKNLKGKEDLLNSRAHKALKEEQFDKIAFKLIDATVIPQQNIIKATGNLTISGVTKKVLIQTTYTVGADESITCRGSKTIKMSEFNIKAPSFMMGALKVADDVTIDILLKLRK